MERARTHNKSLRSGMSRLEVSGQHLRKRFGIVQTQWWLMVQIGGEQCDCGKCCYNIEYKRKCRICRDTGRLYP